jgi:hypothetical protein
VGSATYKAVTASVFVEMWAKSRRQVTTIAQRLQISMEVGENPLR